MRFTKPTWVMHRDSAKDTKRLSIFSIHVHPDGSRIATGGLDAKVRIWSTKPIINPASERSNRPPKSLCTLSMHTGPVLTVRWAHSGRWLASGSDDEIIMIWDHDPSSRGKVFGSNEINIETWKPMKRLPGHESDVVDIAWAPDDRYLASVGLDSKVIIWCGYTLGKYPHERIRKLDQHNGFVKGVCFDPVGEFMATQSDDKTVKIWRTTDWGLEAEVTKPFEDSPGSTFFRRLSWSPDGAHITASNATNNKGFVFIAAVITRGLWTSEISLVGHENTVEVASYNPHIFLRNPDSPLATSNICSVVALGADDRSISIWQTKTARPLIVAREVFDFDAAELEGIAPYIAQTQYLHKFGFVPPPVPEGYSHGTKYGDDSAPTASRITPPPSPNPRAASQSTQSGFGTTAVNGCEYINRLVAKKSTKKRVQPILMSSIPSAATALPSRELPLAKPKPKPASPSVSPVPSMRGFDADIEMGGPMDMEVPIDSLEQSPEMGRGKRKASVLDDELPVQPRTLGGGMSERERRGERWEPPRLLHAPDALPSPAILTYLSAKVDGSEDVLEARNSEGAGPTEVLFVSGKQTQWLDYLPSPVVGLTASMSFCAVALQDGSVSVYSHTGRRNVKSQSVYFPPTTVDSLLSRPNCTILSATIRPNGAPVIQCSTGVAYSFDPQLCSWIKLSERWWAEGSDVWQSRQRVNKDIHRERPEWWSTALTLGHLEVPSEYKQALLLYAKKIADEGFRAKGEELIRDLFGPVYWRPGRDDCWCPTVVGMPKRDLLREVLSLFARSKTLTKLALDWQDTLKKATNDEIA
ncbi:histone transcription regulator 1 [Boletus edulis]|nr:histone transcription regulator 1 [Boletus edulis]